MVNEVKKKKKFNKQDVFYWLVLLYPLVQFALFYVYVNFKSVMFTFQEWSLADGAFVFRQDIFGNIKDTLQEMFTSNTLQTAFKNSLILLVGNLLIGTTFSILFSYYIYKKGIGSEVFKVVLYLPSIISSICLAVIFNYFVEDAYPALVELLTGKEVVGLLGEEKTMFTTILFYTLITGFAAQILMYCGAMSGIPQEMVEAAELDGCTYFKELFYITLPSIWGTLTTFVVVQFAHTFTNQMNLFNFFGTGANNFMYTMGYYLYRKIKISESFSDYPSLASMGVILTVITIPVTLLVNKLMKKLGPKED